MQMQQQAQAQGQRRNFQHASMVLQQQQPQLQQPPPQRQSTPNMSASASATSAPLMRQHMIASASTTLVTNSSTTTVMPAPPPQYFAAQSQQIIFASSQQMQEQQQQQQQQQQQRQFHMPPPPIPSSSSSRQLQQKPIHPQQLKQQQQQQFQQQFHQQQFSDSQDENQYQNNQLVPMSSGGIMVPMQQQQQPLPPPQPPTQQRLQQQQQQQQLQIQPAPKMNQIIPAASPSQPLAAPASKKRKTGTEEELGMVRQGSSASALCSSGGTTSTLFGQMPFSYDEVSAIGSRLQTPLVVEDVMVRKGPAGKKLLYLTHEGTVNNANELFGWDGWSFDILDFSENVQYLEAEKVRITVRVFGAIVLKNGIFKKDFGFGTAVGTFADAWEMGYKTASSDCQKRCLRLFGSYLGNCLYNKDFADALLNEKMRANPKLA